MAAACEHTEGRESAYQKKPDQDSFEVKVQTECVCVNKSENPLRDKTATFVIYDIQV